MKLILKHVLCYGQHRYYPACQLGKLFCELLGRKSLTLEQTEIIAKYKIIEVELRFDESS